MLVRDKNFIFKKMRSKFVDDAAPPYQSGFQMAFKKPSM